MFEIFTDRARKVLELAKNEARDSDVNVGPQHILVGLLREGSGVAHHVLEAFDISVKKVRDEFSNLPSEKSSDSAFTDQSKQVFEDAVEEASVLKHTWIGTEHLLLGILKREEGIASLILQKIGLKLEELREYTLELLGLKPIGEVMKDYEELKLEVEKLRGNWELEDSFKIDPLSAYNPEWVDMWVMKYGFILDNLFYREITVAETKHRRIEIDYSNNKFNAIRIYKRKLS
jgi:ATP-dependent Clp protease ATP-binding subunit ClpA